VRETMVTVYFLINFLLSLDAQSELHNWCYEKFRHNTVDIELLHKAVVFLHLARLSFR